MILERVKKLQEQIQNPILVKKQENLFYLTGRGFDLRAEEYLLVTKKHVVGFGSGLERISWIKKSDELKNPARYLKPATKLEIEYGFTFGEAKYLKYLLPGTSIKPASSPADKAREIKSPEEIRLVGKSMGIVEAVYLKVKKQLKNNHHTEASLASFIESAGVKMGASGISFPPIVASGANAAIPHHVPANKKLMAGESIIIDFGFKYKGYCSDFTRTVFIKRVPAGLEKIYSQVEKSYLGAINFINKKQKDNRLQEKSLKTVINGVRAKDVYQRAVDILAEQHLDRYFMHSLGHGTGLEIHELPSLSQKSPDVLKPGMVFSIEPGVYIPKIGGVRIEDLVVLKEKELEKFIKVSTKLKDNTI